MAIQISAQQTERRVPACNSLKKPRKYGKTEALDRINHIVNQIFQLVSMPIWWDKREDTTLKLKQLKMATTCAVNWE